jgi:predicted ATPase/class 3 adenylate cyclase
MDLAEQVDPEEWHRILDRFFQILADGVHRFEGTVNQYTGDGIMALFGAPIAHEDHAQRACYAALRLRGELRRYADEVRVRHGLNFGTRIGIHSGEVVVGKIGDDLRMDYTAQGHTVGLAARMEQLAPSDCVYLSERTARLTEGYFTLRSLGEAKVHGVSEPVGIYELEDVGPLRTRLAVAERQGLVRFVGRRGEMEQLHRAWKSAQEGHGQIVAVLGEAGVGKSRLFHEFKGRLEAGSLMLEAFSVSHGKAQAYLPVIELLRSYFGIGLGDDERCRREKVTGKVLTLDRALEDALPYLFALLGIADPGSSLSEMDPEIRRRRTLEAIRRVLVRETLDRPLVLVFEDLHWVDSETQALLELLVEGLATVRLLLLVNYRPQYRHEWGSKTYYTQLRLDPLGPEEAQELLTALLGEAATGADVDSLRSQILERTEGNPFFMEEMVQTLAEEGVLAGERGGYRLESAPRELHIPATVEGVLAARIDRLPAEEKELLQTLAVVGKEFPFGLAHRISDLGEGDLHRLLSRLQAGEFLYEQPAFPEPEYTFKHALTQQVAYESLLVDRRKVLHERAGRAIEALHPGTLDAHYGELAHHYGRSEDSRKAVEYLHLAGRQAVERSAYGEAIEHLTGGLERLQALPETPQRDQQELLLQMALGPVWMATRSWSAPEVEAAYARARVLCGRVGDPAQLFSALQGLFTFHQARGDHLGARDLAQEALSLAKRLREPALLMLAHSIAGAGAFWAGELGTARTHLEEALALYAPERHRSHQFLRGGADPGVFSLGYLGNVLTFLGYPEQARVRDQEALQLAHELSHPFSIATALSWVAGHRLIAGEPQPALEQSEALIALATEDGFPRWLGFGTFLLGWALAELGQEKQGLERMRPVADTMRAAGMRMGMPGLLVQVAQAYGRAGLADEGLAAVAEALELVEQTGERVGVAELHATRGGLLLAASEGNEAEAEACFRQALDVARSQGARSFELVAATGLARLWQQQGKRKEASELLAPVYDWFTEGFDTRDLKEARALLDELG